MGEKRTDLLRGTLDLLILKALALLAIRAALGASRGRITAELINDSLILAVLGGVLGVGLAYGAVRALVAAAPPCLPRL
jgi:ABC-type lipoprotein release transport system permease subunit